MLRKLLLILLSLSLLTVTACSPAAQPASSGEVQESAAPEETLAPAEAEGEQAQATPEPEAEESVSSALLSDVLLQTENFSVLLLQNRISANTEQNTVFSPLGLNSVLATLYAAALGDTEEEIRTTLDYQAEPEDIVSALSYLISVQNSDLYSLGNSLHLTRRVTFSETFLDQVASPLRVGTYSVDYSDLSAYQSVNACAELVTNGQVSALLESTTAADTLFLISGFGLQAALDLPFDPSLTQNGYFESSTGLVCVPMMTGDFELGYAEDDYMQRVSLPLSDGRLSLDLILPRADSLSAFTEALPQYADAWLSSEALTNESVTLQLPSFTLSSGDSYLESLSSMGLEKSLRAQTADFSGMISSDLLLPAPLNDLFSVCSLTLSESGISTDAQSAPVEVSSSEESIELTFDRPFLMAVTDNQTGALLMISWINTVSSGR